MATFNNKLVGKKASLVDPIFSGAYILKVAVTILICLFVWVSFQTLMTSQIAGTSSETVLTGVMSTLRNAYFSMDYMFPVFVGGLLIVSTIFAFKTGSNIIWGMFAIVLWAIALLMSALFVNVYLSVSDQFPAIYAEMPVMDIIMSNLHWFTLFWLVIITVVMFRKNNVEDESSEISRRAYGV
jgi:hypothetical protein